MKRSVFFIVILSLSISVFSQEKEEVLVTINGEKTLVSEFKRVYEKNLDAIDNVESKDVENNLILFINYKLKVKEAYNLKLDTLQSYTREIEAYRNQLSAPYLQDKSFIDKLVSDAFFRTKNEVRARHILIRTLPNASPKDTLKAFTKISEIRNRIINGEPFEKVAQESSEDPSAQTNGGDLGYFSAFRMVYPFEEAAYKTKVGKVSKPFKTQYGYHILEVNDFRESRGEVEVAHILISDTTSVGKIKIDEVFGKLQKEEKFEDLAKEYSNDDASKYKGGKLSKFGTGRMLKPFEDAAFSLSEINEFSKPIKTRFGWHIIKLLKTHPIKPFNELKQDISNKIKKSGRMQLSDKAVLDKLKKKYTIVEYEAGKEVLKKGNIRTIAKDSLQNTLFSIDTKNIKQIEFTSYIRNRRQIAIPVLFEKFKDHEILKYYKENLINTEPEYAATLKEYEDGLLLFELMQQKIWNKSSKDTLGLNSYFDKNLNKYNSKELNTVRGEVMNDYQAYLDKNWVTSLRKNNKVNVNTTALKKLIKIYQNK